MDSYRGSATAVAAAVVVPMITPNTLTRVCDALRTRGGAMETRALLVDHTVDACEKGQIVGKSRMSPFAVLRTGERPDRRATGPSLRDASDESPRTCPLHRGRRESIPARVL